MVMAQVLAHHGPAGDLVCKGIRRVLAALPKLTVEAAELTAFRGVNSVQSYPLAVDFQGVAVDHGSDAGHVGQGRGGEQAEGDDERAHGYSVTWLGQKESPASTDLLAAMSAFLRIWSALPPGADLPGGAPVRLGLTRRRPTGGEV